MPLLHLTNSCNEVGQLVNMISGNTRISMEECCLDKRLYVKLNNIATIDANIFNEKDYIAALVNFDLRDALLKISEFIDSGEAPW